MIIDNNNYANGYNNLAERLGLVCDICAEAYQEPDREPQKLDCLHSFCKQCIQSWQDHKLDPTCPMCRKPFTTYHADELLKAELKKMQGLAQNQLVYGKINDQIEAFAQVTPSYLEAAQEKKKGKKLIIKVHFFEQAQAEKFAKHLRSRNGVTIQKGTVRGQETAFISIGEKRIEKIGLKLKIDALHKAVSEINKS